MISHSIGTYSAHSPKITANHRPIPFVYYNNNKPAYPHSDQYKENHSSGNVADGGT